MAVVWLECKALEGSRVLVVRSSSLATSRSSVAGKVIAEEGMRLVLGADAVTAVPGDCTCGFAVVPEVGFAARNVVDSSGTSADVVASPE